MLMMVCGMGSAGVAADKHTSSVGMLWSRGGGGTSSGSGKKYRVDKVIAAAATAAAVACKAMCLSLFREKNMAL